MGLSQIFDVFSRRPDATTKPNHQVPETTRNRILLWWSRNFSNPFVGNELANEFWGEIHSTFQLRLGKPVLCSGRPPSQQADAINYVLGCPGEHFLDFLEDLFRSRFYRDLRANNDQVIDELNELLRVDRLPYHVTKFATETSERELNGRVTTTYRITAYPKVVMRESEILHATAAAPALNLLRNPVFASANQEYLAALEDFRKGDYGDCLTKCGSAFESVMKVLCHRKGWQYKETDAAAALVKTVIGNTSLESYFEQLLIIVATLRNRIGSAHGAGTGTKVVPIHLARYALNATASAMLLLTDEAGL